ncbi:MAG: glycoside hydrolase family 2, partial [bacterium]|nr:glycoside hydrolase family 2 [bacterium]
MLRVVAKTNLCCALLTVAVLASLGCGGSVELPATRVELRDGWSLQSAVEIEADGTAISQPGFDSGSWISGSAPSTVMAALVADGQYPDLYFADNLEQVPQERFTGAWWYRTEFEIAVEDVSRVTRLALDGINYSANVWLNGELLADRDTIVGAFRMHEIDLAGRVTPRINALAIEVFPPQPGDFTIGFVDWNPTPPDRNMGVWRPVALRLSGDVSLNDVFVTSDVDTETLTSADVQVSGVVVNHSSEKASAAIRGEFGEVSFSKTIDLEPNERQALIFSADAFPELHLEAPELWWPYTLGEPHLYSLRMTVEIDGQISDSTEVDFGVREVSSYFNEEGHRGFKVNGKPVLIRGGGWVDDLLLANTPEKISAQMEYVKHLGLNTVRLEGFWGSDSLLYDIADQEGVLLMPGWSCQWEWEEYLGKPVDEYGGVTTPEEMDLVAASMADQARWLRNHPSVFTWVLASDLLPRPELEKRYE